MNNNEDKTKKGDSKQNSIHATPDQKAKSTLSPKQALFFEKMGIRLKVKK